MTSRYERLKHDSVFEPFYYYEWVKVMERMLGFNMLDLICKNM